MNKKLESHQDFSVKKIAVWLEMQQLQSATNCSDIVLEHGNIENKTIYTPPPLAQLTLIFLKKSKMSIITTKNGTTKNCCLRWLDTVSQGQYLPSLSINYVAINKVLEKLPPQLY